jgi:hypothetical protein
MRVGKWRALSAIIIRYEVFYLLGLLRFVDR